jgi:hypothetical protein
MDECRRVHLQTDYHDAKDRLFQSEQETVPQVDAYVLKRLDQKQQVVNPTKQIAVPNTIESPSKLCETSEATTTPPTKVPLQDIVDVREYLSSPQTLHALSIQKRNSYAELSISSTFFGQISEEIHIPWEFRDFLLYFGRRSHEVEIAAPPLVIEAKKYASPNSLLAQSIAGIVRFVEDNGRASDSSPSVAWSIRQTAFSFSHLEATCQHVWLFISLSPKVEIGLGQLWACNDHDASYPFSTLHILYEYAARSWRAYTVALTQEIEQHESVLLGTSPDDTGPVSLPGAEDRQALLILERKLSVARLAVQATKADVEFVVEQLGSSPANSSTRDLGNHQRLLYKFAMSARVLDMNLLRFDELQHRLRNLTSLLSDFLNLHGSFALQVLSQESKRENEAMRELNEEMAKLAKKNAEESVTITVLAILTTIYLPFTVVSNFFSTSFVGTGAGGDKIFVTRDCWILFVISLPLTLLTIYIWRAWSNFKINGRLPSWWVMLGLKHKRVSTEHRPFHAWTGEKSRTFSSLAEPA